MLRPITLGVNTPASVGYVTLGTSQRQRNLLPPAGKCTFCGRPAKNLVDILSFLNYLKKTYNKSYELIYTPNRYFENVAQFTHFGRTKIKT
jgi:hypothetical protein